MIPRTASAARGLAAVAVAMALAVGGRAPSAANGSPDKSSPGKVVAALGRLEPQGGIVRIAAPSVPDAVSGAILVTLHVDRGQDVKPGQLLAELDTAAISKARITETTADLETARRDAKAVSSLADEACVRADVAARRSRRMSELLVRKLASEEDAEEAKGEAEAGAASCAARRTAARVAESRISSVEARLALHRAELERSYIRAPFAGRVLDLHARPGELVGLGGILELGRVAEMQAIAEVYETDIRRVRTGQKARVKSDALAGVLTGTVTRIRPKVQKMDQIGTDPAARKDARIVEVEVRLDEPGPVAGLTNLQVEVEIGR